MLVLMMYVLSSKSIRISIISHNLVVLNYRNILSKSPFRFFVVKTESEFSFNFNSHNLTSHAWTKEKKELFEALIKAVKSTK
jgi:hypothetical protein